MPADPKICPRTVGGPAMQALKLDGYHPGAYTHLEVPTNREEVVYGGGGVMRKKMVGGG